MRRSLAFAAGPILAAGLLVGAPYAVADEPRVEPRTVASSCGAVTSSAAVAAWATRTGVVSSSSGGVAGASVYAINTETGAQTCDVTDANGVYSLELPATGAGGNARAAADFWLIVANPPLDSNLSSNSSVLRSATVAGSSSQATDLALSAPTSSVVITLNGDDTAAFACAYSDKGGPLPVTCGLAQSYVADDSMYARLALAPGIAYQVDGSLFSDGVLYEGFLQDEVRSTTQRVAVELEPTGLPDCTGLPAKMGGSITKSGGIPTRASVGAFALLPDGPQRILGTWSLPNGQFRTCTGNVPNGYSQNLMVATYTGVMGGNAYLKPLAGLTDDSLLNLELDLSAPVQVGGTVQADGAPLVGSQWNIAQFRDGAPQIPIFQDSRTDYQGRWGVFGLPDDTYALLAYPADDDATRAMSITPFVIRNGTVAEWAGQPQSPAFPFAAPPVALSPANVTGTATRPNGSPQASSTAFLEACADLNDESTCIKRGGRTNSLGQFGFTLPDDTYYFQVTVQPQWWESGTIETTSPIATKPQNGSAVVNLTMSQPNAEFLIQAAGNSPSPIPGASASLAKFVGTPLSDPWQNVTNWAEADSQGILSLNFDVSGVYRMEVRSPYDNWGPQVTTYMNVAVGEDRTVLIDVCEVVLGDGMPCSAESDPLSKEGSTWLITRPVANVSGTLVSAAGSDDTVSGGGIQIERVTGLNRQWFGYSQTGSEQAEGRVSLYLPPGTYVVQFDKPRRSSQPWAANSYFMTADDTGVCVKEELSAECTPTSPLDMTFNLLTGNFFGTVKSVNGSSVSQGWVQVFRSLESGEEYVTGTQISNGSFVLNLPDGSYSFVITSNSNADGVATRFAQDISSESVTREFVLKAANVTGKVLLADSSPAAGAQVEAQKWVDAGDSGQWQWVNAWAQADGSGEFALNLDPGTYRLRVQPQSGSEGAAVTTSEAFTLASEDDTKFISVTLSVPNVQGVVNMPAGAAAAYSWIELRKWSNETSQYEWSEAYTGSMSDQNGEFHLALPDGRWQLTANPPWGDTTASRTSVNVVVSGQSVCLDSGAGVCSGDSVLSVVITLTAPNVSGTVKFQSGNPAANTWIDVRPFDINLGRYEWDPAFQGINVNFDGSFSATLADGDYRLTANPPWGNSTATRSTTDITVQSPLVCLTATKPCGADDSIAPGALNLILGEPNIQGAVLADSVPVAFSNLQVEKWNSDIGQWQWQEIWANSSANGSYALNLSDAGSYRLTAQPTNLTSDFSAGRAYAYVADGKLCAPANEAAAESDDPCAATNSSLTLNVSLAGADLIGKVTNGSDPLRDAWVSLLQRNSSGWYDWVGGTPSRVGGKFALSLDDSTAEYRIEVFPPWGGNADLTRKSVDIVAYALGSNERVCLKADWNETSATCSADISELTIALSGGNVRGFVKPPTGDTGIRDAGISVEKWVEAPWNPGSGQYVWQWADLFTDSRSGGAFSLSIDTPGTYRLEARPPWNNPSGLSSGRKIITVNGSGAWCEQEDTTGSTASAHGACEGPISTDDSRLTIRLATPNVTTRVYSQSGGTPVADAWVTLFQDVVKTVPGGSADDTYVSRVWIGGTPTNADGFVYLNVTSAGAYSLEVYPPWQSGTALPKFTKDFTVVCSGASCTESGLDDSIWFPQPNLSGFVLSADDSSTKVPNAWVSVEKDMGGGDFRWTDQGTSTNGKGKYVLSLENGTYRITANPAWDDPKGVARTVTVSVTGGNATCTSGCLANSSTAFDIQLRKANVSGSLIYGSGVPMPYGWVQVTQGANFITGSGTNAQGNFSLNLPDGTYTLTGYPNWSVAAKPPVTTTVVVSGGVVTSGPVVLDLELASTSLVLTIGGNVSGNRFVAVAERNGSAWVDLPDQTAVASGGVARFGLPAGTYLFTVIPDIGKTARDNTVEVTIDGDGSTQQTASVNPVEVPAP